MIKLYNKGIIAKLLKYLYQNSKNYQENYCENLKKKLNVSSAQIVVNKEIMLKEGLIREVGKDHKKKYSRKYIGLTEKGEKVTILIFELENVLNA